MKEVLHVLRTDAEIQTLIDYMRQPGRDVCAYDTETTSLSLSAEVVGLSVCCEDNVAWYVITAEWRFDKREFEAQCDDCSGTGKIKVKKQPLVCDTCEGRGVRIKAEFSNGHLFRLPNKEKLKELLAVLLEKSLITQNGTVDFNWTLRNYGIDLRPASFLDSMVAAHLISENRRVGLKELGYAEFGEDAKKEQEEMKASVIANGGIWESSWDKKKKRWADKRGGNKEMFKASPEILGKYGAKDALLTYRLGMKFAGELSDRGLDQFYSEESHPLFLGPIYDLNTTGFKCDLEGFRKLQKELEDECAMLKNQIETDIAPYTRDRYPNGFGGKVGQFNIGSGQQLAWLLFVKLDNDWKKLTDSGRDLAKQLLGKAPYNPSGRRNFERAIAEATDEKGRPLKLEKYLKVDKGSLGAFSMKYKWVERLLQFRKAVKILTTYVVGMQEKIQYGCIYPGFLQCSTTGNRLSSRGPNFQQLPREDGRVKRLIVARPGKIFVGSDFCLPEYTEYLTPGGWKTIHEITETTKVWQVDRETLKGSFVLPQRIIKRDFEGTLYRYSSYRGTIEVTENHRMLWVGQQTHRRQDKKAYRLDALAQDGIPNSGCHLACFSDQDTVSSYSDKEIWLALMTQADGSETKNKYRIQVSYPRKREKVAELLGAPGKLNALRACHTMPVEEWRYYFFSPLLKTGKKFDLSTLGSNQVETFIEALCFWDGDTSRAKTNRKVWFTTDKHNADEVQSYLVRSGYECSIVTQQGRDTWTPCYRLSIKSRGTVRFGSVTNPLSSIDVVGLPHKGVVGCVTVPTSYILVRQHGLPFVTGNCQVEPRVFASLSGDVRLLACFEAGQDPYSVVGIETFGKFEYTPFKSGPGSFGAAFPLLRQVAKEVMLAATYGITAFRLCDVLNTKAPRKMEEGGPWTIDEVQEIINAYFEAFPDVKKLQLKYHKEVIENGMVFNLFGRPRHIPQAKLIKAFGKTTAQELPYEYRTLLNNSVNFPIQGTAGSIMNRAMIALFKRCRELETQDPTWAEVKIVGSVHDEIWLEGPEHLADQMVAVLQDCMENTVVLPGVRLKADPKAGYTIADLK